MKTFTEQQVRLLLNKILTLSSSVDDAINSLTSIELPSEEQIKERSKEGVDITGAESYERGAKWMKEQMLNQNK